MMNTGEAINHLMGLVGPNWKDRVDVEVEEGQECWCFVRYAFRLLGKDLPHDQYEARHYAEVVHDDPRPFDVVLFRSGLLGTRHVGLAINSREMIHAAEEAYGVSTIRLARLDRIGLLRHKDLLET